MSLHPCLHPGCSVLLPRAGRCSAHAATHQKANVEREKRQRQSNPDIAQAAAIRATNQWRRVRAAKLSMNPLCEDPHGTHAKQRTTATAKQVHHVQPLKDRPDLAYDWDNLMSVCWKCHDVFNRQERKTP